MEIDPARFNLLLPPTLARVIHRRRLRRGRPEPSKEIRMDRDAASLWRKPKARLDDVYEAHETAVVRIGGASVEMTFADDDDVTKPWIRKVSALARGRRLRAPLVAGLVALGGSAPRAHNHSNRRRAGSPSSTVRGIALCVGGSHVLVYQPGAPWGALAGATGKIEFHGNNMAHLRAFLGGVKVVCIGADEASRKLAASWDLHLVGKSDLHDLVERAYGKELVVTTRRVADDGVAKTTAGVGARSLGICELAKVLLGMDVGLEKLPDRVANSDWSRVVEEEAMMYATRDAFLCFEVAVHCFQKLGLPIGA